VIAVLVLLTEDGESLSRTRYRCLFILILIYGSRKSYTENRVARGGFESIRGIIIARESSKDVQKVVNIGGIRRGIESLLFNEDIQGICSSRAATWKVLLLTRIEEAIQSNTEYYDRSKL